MTVMRSCSFHEVEINRVVKTGAIYFTQRTDTRLNHYHKPVQNINNYALRRYATAITYPFYNNNKFTLKTDKVFV